MGPKIWMPFFLLIFYYWSWGKKKLSCTLVRIPYWSDSETNCSSGKILTAAFPALSPDWFTIVSPTLSPDWFSISSPTLCADFTDYTLNPINPNLNCALIYRGLMHVGITGSIHTRSYVRDISSINTRADTHKSLMNMRFTGKFFSDRNK